MEKVNKETGLTPVQEKAAQLLTEGKGITECAEELGIAPPDLYKWEGKPNFQAYCNRLALNQKLDTSQKLLSLQEKALEAIEGCLESDNEAVRFKAAMYIVEKVEKREIGIADVREMLRNQATESGEPFGKPFFSDIFDEKKYKQLCKENGLS